MRAPRRLVPLAVAVLAAGCHDFGVVNQYDPRYPMQLTITGPDTTYSTGQVLSFTLATTPAWTGTAPVWSSSVNNLAPIGDGHFRVASASFAGNTVTITARVGPHQAQKTVKVQQRVASLAIVRRYLTGDTITIDAFEEPFSLEARAYDSAGVYVDLPATATIQLSSRDTQVVRVLSNGPESALATGRTWLVASYAGASDSVLVHVRQVPQGIDCSPAHVIDLAYDDSVRISVTHWYDATGHTMQWTPVLTALQLNTWNGPLTMTADGVAHSGSTPAQGSISAQWRSPDGLLSGTASECLIYVPYP